MMEMMRQPTFETFDCVEDFIQAAVKYILTTAYTAIDASGIFRMVLSGGETPKPIYKVLAEHKENAAFWQAWEIWFADERCVAVDDPQRNSKMVNDIWLNHVPVNRSNVHTIEGELGAKNAASLYNSKLAAVGNFDFTLLGIGNDGHAASLFPGLAGSAQMDETINALPVFDAPKPPSERVTLSVPRLNRSMQVAFLATGEEKKKVINDLFSGIPMPASLISGISNTCFYYTSAK